MLTTELDRRRERCDFAEAREIPDACNCDLKRYATPLLFTRIIYAELSFIYTVLFTQRHLLTGSCT